MYVGLDISKNEIVAVGMDKEGSLLHSEKYELYTEEIDRLVNTVGKDSVFVLEPSTYGVFVYDYLSSKNIQVIAANSAKIQEIRESDKKTDWEDAKILANRARTNNLPTCYLPNKESREQRDLIRHRKSLVDMRSIIKTKMRAILAREGIRVLYSDITGKVALKELNEIVIYGSVQKDAFNRFVHVAKVLNEQIDEYDEKIHERYERSEEAQLLDTIPGISYYSAVHIMSAIVDIHRFPTDQELASYAGLVPKTFQSGEVRRGTHRKHGDKLLTWVLIQDARAAVMKPGKLRRYYLKKKKRIGDKKAIIATARKMVEIIHVMLTRGERYCE
jgi:transposase